MNDREQLERVVQWYTKKPVTIAAYQFTEQMALDCLNSGKAAPWGLRVSGKWHREDNVLHEAYIWIDTLEGKMKASVGDYIINGIKGEIYPCKPDIFEATYQPAQAAIDAMQPKEESHHDE